VGFCAPDEYRPFLRPAPIFERMLVGDGVRLRKYWLSVSDGEQEARFRSRLEDPRRRWKLAPMGSESIMRWEEYSRAKDDMTRQTDAEHRALQVHAAPTTSRSSPDDRISEAAQRYLPDTRPRRRLGISRSQLLILQDSCGKPRRICGLGNTQWQFGYTWALATDGNDDTKSDKIGTRAKNIDNYLTHDP
jgi:hypothetical protein